MDNFDLLCPFLWDRDITDNNFYTIEILQRRKDGHPELTKSNQSIKNYMIYNKEEYYNLKSYICQFCKDNNARAYIKPNIRNNEMVAMETIRMIAEYVVQKNYQAVANAYRCIAGRYSAEINNRWVVDIDYKELEGINKLMGTSMTQTEVEQLALTTIEKLNGKLLLEVPTVYGKHFITTEFNLDEWNKLPYGYGVQIDSLTLLFF